MHFNSELVIKGEVAKKMSEIKNQFSFNYIDIFLYSILLGIDNNLSTDILTENNRNSEESASIPRSVLINYQELLSTIFAVAILKRYENDLSEDILKIAFEDNDDDYKSFEKFKCSLGYFFGGINLLYSVLKPIDGVIRDDITILNGILDMYKGVNNGN